MDEWVASYPMLVRIATGLGVPRGHMFLAYVETLECRQVTWPHRAHSRRHRPPDSCVDHPAGPQRGGPRK